MLVFPAWRPELPALGCRRPQWAPEPRFASYVAPPAPPPHSRPLIQHTQIEDEYSSSSCSSSPEHAASGGGEAWEGARECACEWRGCATRARGVAALSAHVASEHAHAHADGLFYCGWRACSRPHRGFNARYKMLVHVRTHTNEKPHVCSQCHKSFSRAENLKIHLRSHSGEKPYVCPFEGCNKAYSNSSDRFKHTRTHAEDKPYCCKVDGCGKRYTDPSSLRKHVKTYKHYAPAHTAPSSPSAPDSPPRLPTTAPETLPFEPARVPSYDMSYVEYSRLYNGYSSSPEALYPKHCSILRNDDATYEERLLYRDVAMSEATHPRTVEEAEGPLDLKCRRGRSAERESDAWGSLRVHSIEDSMEFQLIRSMELPLDLSNKN